MATKTKKPVKKSMKVETPYPKEHKETKPNDINFIGNELANVSQRVNELELSISDLSIQMKRVMGRMGL